MKVPATLIFKRVISISLTLLIIVFNSFGQEESGLEIEKSLSTGKMKDRAEFAMESGDVYTALFYYEEVTRQNPNDLGARFRLGELYQASRNYKKAEETFAYVYEKGFSQYPFSLYHLGISQKMSGKYEKAKENLKKFQKEARHLGDRDFKGQLRKDIFGCDSGIVFTEFPDNVVINNAGSSVNDPHTEFSPVFLDSTTILFGSLREETLNFYDIEKENKTPRRQIYQAEKVNGTWEEKGKFEVVNDPEMQMGNLAYSPKTDKYYFTKCARNIKGKVVCKIYSAQKVRGKYQEAEELPAPVNMEEYTTTQPCIKYDTARNIEYLYFVSDRPGGRGGLDIWYTYYNSRRGSWTDPKNARSMNSSGTDCTPFYHAPTQTFYFSSDGRISAGGLDIYKFSRDEQGRAVLQNLAFPINSPQDDFDFHLGDNGRNGFLVSNRPGGTPFFHETCCDDIFAFEIFPPKPFEATLDLTLVTSDSSCKDKLIAVEIYDLKTKELQNKRLRMRDTCSVSIPLSKNTRYKFSIEKEGFEPDSIVVLTREMSATAVIEKNLSLQPIEKEEEKVIAEAPVEGESFVLNDIQYATDKYHLNEEAKAVVDSVLIPFLKKYPKDKLLISSHTDNHGSKRYNENLSQKRAEFVAKYLVEKGIPENKIEAKGFGENKPIAPNENPDGTDNPLGRAQNRRTEFLLVKP